MQALIIEDDPTIADFVARGVSAAGHRMDTAGSAEEAREALASRSYDVLVVDIMLPGQDGLSFIEQQRASGLRTPILILSARHSVDDRIRGIRTGGDDYMVKPFSLSELLVRLEALVRRSVGITESMEIRVADLEIDVLGRRCKRQGTEVELQPREFDLLVLLARNPDRVLSKSLILERIWDYHFDPQTNVVDVLVSRLRKKVDRDFQPRLIHTVRGLGYVLRIPTER